MSNNIRFYRIAKSTYETDSIREYLQGNLYFIHQDDSAEGEIFLCTSPGVKGTAVFEKYASPFKSEQISTDIQTISFPYVEYVEQILTETQKVQARENIGVNIDENEFIAISGSDQIPLFTEEEPFIEGEYVYNYGYNPDGELVKYVYRFNKNHQGPWVDDDVIQTSVFGELKNLVIGDTEHVIINVSSSDGQVSVSGIQVSFEIEGGATTILTCDENGNCEINVPKNSVYTISIPDRSGYQHVPFLKARANSNLKYVYLVYEKEISGETCTVSVRLVRNGGRAESDVLFSGVTVNLLFNDGSARSSVTDANGVATFTNVKKGFEVHTGNPKILGFVTPNSYSFSTVFDTISFDLTYNMISAAGIWMVRDDGAEIDYENWDTSDTCTALHFATQALVDDGNDYYVRINDLTSAWFVTAHNKTWCNSTKYSFPNVKNWSSTAPHYNGREATYNMIQDAADLGLTTAAASFVVEETFTLRGNTANGFMGTRDQWQVIVDNNDIINLIYSLIGKTSVWFSKNIWTSSQNSAGNSCNWYGGSWSSGFKTISIAVVPFFAI